MKPVNEFFCGFLFIFKGTKILFQKTDLLKWAIIPFVINTIIVLLALNWSSSHSSWIATQTMNFFFNQPEGVFYNLLYYPIKLAFLATYTVAIIYAAFLFATVIASPFNALLAERTLFHLGFINDKPFCLGPWLRSSLKMLIASILRAGTLAFIGLFIFIFSFVPILNLVAAFAAFLIIALDCIDYSMEARLMSLRQRWTYFLRTPFYFCGMTLALSLTAFIPGFTLLLLPSSVAGAAWVMTKAEDNSENSTPQSHLQSTP